MRDPKDIKTEIKGATYDIPVYSIKTDVGIVCAGNVRFEFLKGDKSDESKLRQTGFITETMLATCKQYLQDVNEGELENEYTIEAINCIQQALNKLDERRKNREDRDVSQTHKK